MQRPQNKRTYMYVNQCVRITRVRKRRKHVRKQGEKITDKGAIKMSFSPPNLSAKPRGCQGASIAGSYSRISRRKEKEKSRRRD